MSDHQPQPRPPGLDRLRRSLHFVPGADERLLVKSIATAADGLVLDLEDAVTPDRKASARGIVGEWLRTVDFRGKERVVRINPLDTPWGHDDLRAVLQQPPDALLIPKVSTLADLQLLDHAISALEREHGHPDGRVGLLVVSTETPLGALNVATFPACRRVIGLTWGAEDLSAVLGVSRNRFPDGRLLDTYRYCRVQTLLAAAAAGVQPLDTAYVDIRNPDGLRAECQEAEGRMAIAFEGKMVDVPHLERAKRLLARAQRIRGLS